MASLSPSEDLASLQHQLRDMRGTIDSQRGTIAALQQLNLSLQGQLDALKRSLATVANENTILLHRLTGSKSERIKTSELQLALGDLLDQQKELQKQLDALTGQGDEEQAPAPPKRPKPPARPGQGRRDLSASSLPRVIVPVIDPELEKQGKCIGFDSSYQLMHIRGGLKLLEIRTCKYEIQVGNETTVLGTPSPKTLFPRALLHSSCLTTASRNTWPTRDRSWFAA
jgi:hypothetical protein